MYITILLFTAAQKKQNIFTRQTTQSYFTHKSIKRAGIKFEVTFNQNSFFNKCISHYVEFSVNRF